MGLMISLGHFLAVIVIRLSYNIRAVTLMYYEILFNKYRNDTKKYGKTIFYQVKRKHYRQVLEKVTVN